MADDDVELLAETLSQKWAHDNGLLSTGTAVQVWRPYARAVLTALAGAGRLLPEGAKRTEELGVRVDEPHPLRKEKAGHVMRHLSRETVEHAPSIWRGWTIVRRTVINHETPWVEITDE